MIFCYGLLVSYRMLETICVQTNYYWIEIGTLNHMIVYELLVLDMYIWNRITVFVLGIFDII